MNKRDFIKNSIIAGAGVLGGANFLNANTQTINNLSYSTNDWETIRRGYDLSEDFINLENGYYCVQPTFILNAYQKYLNAVNQQGAYYMRTVQFQNKQKSALALSELAGCDKEELIITRNTTESLNLIISGFKWQANDEAVFAEQDYGAMQDMFKQVAKRYGIKNVVVSIPNQPKNDDEIVEIYRKAITPKTKLLMVCHVINITGQVLPVKKIVDMAHQLNVKVMVDGAHAFAHIPINLKELGCDYYGTSLHKWLSCPLGAGFLFVRKELIDSVWPLFAENDSVSNTEIANLNHTGTIPVHTDLTILDAIKYYQFIGAKTKLDRLLTLRNYWVNKVKDLPKIIINSPLELERSCAIANVGVKGIKPSDLAKKLLEKYKIFTVAIETNTVNGVRVTPNIYSTFDELDIFVNALKTIAA
jgi:selenocysteine lyase/cysteine desulfurase